MAVDEIGFDLDAVFQSTGPLDASDFLFSEPKDEVSDSSKVQPKSDEKTLSAVLQQRLYDAMDRIRNCFRSREDLLYDVSVHLLHHDISELKQRCHTTPSHRHTKMQDRQDKTHHDEVQKRQHKQHVVVVSFRKSVISYYVHFLRMEYPEFSKSRDALFESAVNKLHDTVQLALRPEIEAHDSVQTASAADMAIAASSSDQPAALTLAEDLPFRILLYSDKEISALKASVADTSARRERRRQFLTSAQHAGKVSPLDDQELKLFLHLQQVESDVLKI